MQGYYTTYHATQALAVAKGFPRPNNHPKTQNLYVDFWLKPTLDLSPWTLGAAATGKWRNQPSGREILDVHPWVACRRDNQLNLAAKAFRTTRNDSVEEACGHQRERLRGERRRKWQEEERERVQRGRRPRRERPGRSLGSPRRIAPPRKRGSLHMA